jgi:SAM-dependent methyltransferase
MGSPWLSVPLEDYEGHMRSASVGQLDALADLFAEALAIVHPRSVAVLGVAGGNGLDRIDPAVTGRIVGIDVNPRYLEAARRRFPEIPSLELHCLDLAHKPANLEPVELVHAAMIFEHAGPGLCLENALSLVAAGGRLSVVLQLPSETEPGVAATEFASIQNLRGEFSLIDPAWFGAAIEGRGFRLIHQTRRELPAGKAFWMGIFAHEKDGAES